MLPQNIFHTDTFGDVLAGNILITREDKQTYLIVQKTATKVFHVILSITNHLKSRYHII